jgi:hypothetical protein
MMQKRKEKPKRGDDRNHLDFVSPFTIKRCIERLELAQVPFGFLRSGMKVEFFYLDENTCEFVVHKGSKAQVRGRLINEYGITTRVECFASITPNVVVENAGMIIICLMVLVAAVNNPNRGEIMLLFGFMGVVSFATVYQNMQAPRELLNEIEQILPKVEN